MRLLHSQFEDKRHVIWDWNGTLLSDIEHAVQIVNKMLSEERLPAITLAEYKDAFGFPVIDYYQKLGFDTSPQKFHELCERFNRYFYTDLNLCDLWPGARQTLRYVRDSGRMQSVLSASEQSALDESIKHFALHDVFDHVIGIADKKAGSKVDRGRELMQKAGVPAVATIMIGDTDHDLEVGQALGIEVVLVEHGHQCPTRLRAKHHRVVKVF